MTGIYMFTNKCNGKSYIGQSVDIDRRYKEHRFRKERSLFHSEIEYYGFSNFDFVVLEECPIEELNDKEILYIDKFDTLFPRGYNLSTGGQTPHLNALVNYCQVGEIIELLKNTTLTNSQIGELFGISDQMVSDINCGRSWIRDGINYPIRNGRGVVKRSNFKPVVLCSECGCEISKKSKTCLCRSCYNKKQSIHIPSRDDLISDLMTGTFESVARKYGVSSNAIRKWCAKYDIPKNSQKYKELS